MNRMVRPTSRPRLLLALIVPLALALGWAVAPSPAQATLSAWDGGISLYREGTFTTQKSWLWCTAADVQIMRNIVERDNDHTTSGQRRYFEWMRARNRYDLPESAGVDPQGWTASLRHFVDDRYRLLASKTFDAAVRSAVTNLRRTNLPVAVAVSHGNHGWVLTGFTATADPARTKDFRVTSVRVVGPLYGLQSKNGYDMRPNTKLTTAQFRGFFTAWHYDPKPMIWDGLYVSIQPIPAKEAPVSPAKSPARASTDPATMASMAAPSSSPSPTIVPAASPTASPTPIAVAALTSPRAAGATPAADPTAASASGSGPPEALLAVLTALAVLAAVGWRLADPTSRPPRGRDA
jgi:hypothetical protein